MKFLLLDHWKVLVFLMIVPLLANGAIISKIQEPSNLTLELSPNDSIALEKIYHTSHPSGTDQQLLNVQMVCSQKKKKTVNYSCEVVTVASPRQE